MKRPPIVHPELAKASFDLAVEPLLTHGPLFAKEGIRLVHYEFPSLDLELTWKASGHPIRLRVDGTDFPYRPIDGWWTDENGGRLATRIPCGAGFHIADPDGTSRAWFCWLGWAGFHDHQSHQDTSWATIRNDKDYRVIPLLQRLVRALNEPGVQIA